MSKNRQKKLARETAQKSLPQQPQAKGSPSKKSSGPAKVGAMGSGWSSMTNWLVVLIALVPFIISRKSQDPTITIRYIILGVFILLFVLYFFGLKKTNGLNPPLPQFIKIIFGVGIAYCLWSFISMSFATNFSAGIYDVSRQLLNLTLLFIVMLSVRNEGSQVLKICNTLALVAILHSYIGIAQYFEFGFNDLPGANAKPYGLMANRNLYGSAQAFILPFSIYVLYKASRIWKYVAGLAITGIILSVIISQTRSAWIGVLLILVVSLVLVIIYSQPNRRKWVLGSVAALAVIMFSAFLLVYADHNSELSKSIKQRAASLTTLRTDTTQSFENAAERVKISKKTISMIKDHKMFGVGPGNWPISVPAYGTSGLAWSYGWYVPDRPHNVYLQIASETGIPGAILYFGIFLLIAIAGFKTLKRTTNEDQRILVILIMAGLAAFASDCMFSFPTERIEHSIYIMLMAGIILGSFAAVSAAAQNKVGGTGPNGAGRQLLIVFSVVALFNLFVGSKKMSFEKHMVVAKALENQGRFQDEIDEVNAGKSFFVNIDINGVPLEVRSAIAYDKLKNFPKALSEINKAKSHNPNSAMIYNNMGTIYTDMKDFDKAIDSYEKALKIAPDYDIIKKNLSVNYFNKERWTDCINMTKRLDTTDAYFKDILGEARRRMAGDSSR